ncbi:hypothetical protein HaLaN_14845, partial [Haematococcus lacustris]
MSSHSSTSSPPPGRKLPAIPYLPLLPFTPESLHQVGQGRGRSRRVDEGQLQEALDADGLEAVHVQQPPHKVSLRLRQFPPPAALLGPPAARGGPGPCGTTMPYSGRPGQEWEYDKCLLQKPTPHNMNVCGQELRVGLELEVGANIPWSSLVGVEY